MTLLLTMACSVALMSSLKQKSDPALSDLKEIPSLFTPIVTLSLIALGGVGGALMLVSPSDFWRSFTALVFMAATVSGLSISRRSQGVTGVVCRNIRKLRGVLIVASLLLASQLVHRLALALGWFEPGERAWTLEWIFVALTAAALEFISSTTEHNQDKVDPDSDEHD